MPLALLWLGRQRRIPGRALKHVTVLQINNVIKAQTSRVNETISSGPFHQICALNFC
jgi:hypothetical protein